MNENRKQANRLLAALRSGPIDPMRAWRELGIYRLAARKYDLEQMGHVIGKKRKKIQNRFGETCNVAEYYLVAEAPRAGAQ